MKPKLFHRNFSLLIAGQASSLLGNGILDFAMSMYVLDKTGSAAVYAGFLTASMIPSLLWEGSWRTGETNGILWQAWIFWLVWAYCWWQCL